VAVDRRFATLRKVARRRFELLLTPEQFRRVDLLYKRVRGRPPVGFLRFGSLRRVTPFDRAFGASRGTPIDRYYIDVFFRRQSAPSGCDPSDIRGRVLEVGDLRYTHAFGGHQGQSVTTTDVLHVNPQSPAATLIGDLTRPTELPTEQYDCIICTQVLLFIFDVQTAMRSLHQMLRPSGVLLLTVPGIAQICHPDADSWGEYWRFTGQSVRRLAEEVFAPQNVTVETYGNVLSAAAFLYGAAAEDLKQRELEVHDPDYEVTIALRAVKS